MTDLRCPKCGGETQRVNGYDTCLSIDCDWLRANGPAAARAVLDRAKARKDIAALREAIRREVES